MQESIGDSEVLKAGPDVSQALSALAAALHLTQQQLPHSSSKRQYTSTSDSGDNLNINVSEKPNLPEIPDSTLEQAVFMHPSCAKAHETAYDRYEVLGDAYIELIATKLIWNKFPSISSGQISQLRELLVKNETLARFAEGYNFNLKVSVPAEFASNRKRWIKTMGDVFEAYVAAVILSRPFDGYQVAEDWLRDLWLPILEEEGHQKAKLRAKEELAKRIMAKGIKLEYLDEKPPIEEKGSGTQTFFIGVYLTGWGWEKKHLGSGSGASKVAAGDIAAENALLDTKTISQIMAKKASR